MNFMGLIGNYFVIKITATNLIRISLNKNSFK